MATQLERQVRDFLARREGRLPLADFETKWLDAFGTVVDFAANGVEDVQELIDFCSTVCWYGCFASQLPSTVCERGSLPADSLQADLRACSLPDS